MPRVQLDGITLEVDSNGGWDLVAGTGPHTEAFEVHADVAARLVANATTYGSTLLLDASAEGLPSRTVQRLTILAAQPGGLPFTRNVVVVDERYFWKDRHVARSYNVRQATGEYRPLTEGGPLAVRKLIPQEKYRTPSLRDGRDKWTASQVLADVMDLVAGKGRWRLEDALPELPPVEGLEIDHPGDQAVAMVFATLGLALDVYLGLDGIAVIVNRSKAAKPQSGEATRTRGSVVAAADGLTIPGPYLTLPVIQLVDRRHERPSAINVYLTPACEVRIDHVETDTSGAATRAREGDAPPCRSDAVVQVPEDISVDGRTVHAGTWLDLGSYMTWLAAQSHPAGLPPLTTEQLRAGYTSAVLQAYAAPDIDNGGVWARRVAAAFEGFRRRYQIREPWRSRMRRIEPYRVAVLDPARGARADSPVFADWSQYITWRWYGDQVSGNALLDQLIQNRYANPSAASGGSIVGTSIRDLNRAPALVSILDEDQGLYELHYRLDYTGQAATIYPSAFDQDTIPSVDPKARNRWLEWATLSPTHEVSVIVTCVPMAPNGLRRLHKVTITPDQVTGMLGAEVGPCTAPPRDLRLAVDRVARFAWQDDKADAIRRFFSPGSDLTVQGTYGDPINVDEVTELARAAAARLYGRLLDRPQGSVTVAFNPDLTIKGTVAAIRHRFNRQGAYTVVELMPDPPPVDADFFLSPGIRRVVQRLLDP